LIDQKYVYPAGAVALASFEFISLDLICLMSSSHLVYTALHQQKLGLIKCWHCFWYFVIFLSALAKLFSLVVSQ